MTHTYDIGNHDVDDEARASVADRARLGVGNRPHPGVGNRPRLRVGNRARPGMNNGRAGIDSDARLGGRGITGICLAVCGLLTIVWGGTVVPVSLLSGDFMSFVAGGLVLFALGVCLVSALPPALHVAAVWLAAVGLIVYTFAVGMEAIVALIGCVPIVGFAAWITTRLWR